MLTLLGQLAELANGLFRFMTSQLRRRATEKETLNEAEVQNSRLAWRLLGEAEQARVDCSRPDREPYGLRADDGFRRDGK